jgi:hypothetical protein
MRRLVVLFTLASALSVLPAQALTVREIIELSKSGVGDDVLLALIEVDQRVFTMDPATIKQLKASGVSEKVIVALVKSGRTPADATAVPPDPIEPVAVVPTAAQPQAVGQVQPQVIVIDHHDQAPQVVPVPVPVAVPVVVPNAIGFDRRLDRVHTTFTTEDGTLLRANVPLPVNCIKAEPVFWGNGGKRRAGTWEPPTQVVCR